jgi:NitT/TauT family transport system ATP-binding protein
VSQKILIRDVDKIYGTKQRIQALTDVSLTVEDGEFVCIVGPSGCGKSTLLRMIANLHRPTSGSVEIVTERTKPWPTAMVFQDYGIFPWKTVEQNVAFGLRPRGVGKAEARERVGRWLERMGLADFAGAYPASLSGGMRQRVSIARAMAVEPEVLLMDEPFAALDAQLRRVLQEELLGIWQEDARTVVFVTHSLDEAILLGDRVVVMSARPGRVIDEHNVPFPRPRTPQIRTTAEFAELEGRIWEQLRGQVEHHDGDDDPTPSPRSPTAEVRQ